MGLDLGQGHGGSLARALRQEGGPLESWGGTILTNCAKHHGKIARSGIRAAQLRSPPDHG